MKKFKTGNATVEIEQDLGEMFLGFLKFVAPNAERIMDEELDKIEEEALKDWPQRKPIVRTNKEGEIVFFRRTTQKSWKMFRRGARVLASGVLEVYLKNTANYSYVMRFGVDSKNKDGKDIIQPQGKRVADELMIKPLRRSANRVVKALAEDLKKRL
jgi:hypothetical protein